MIYRVTWFYKDSGRVHSEGEYNIDKPFKEVADYYRSPEQLMKGDGCCIMVDPFHFPHGATGSEPESK